MIKRFRNKIAIILTSFSLILPLATTSFAMEKNLKDGNISTEQSLNQIAEKYDFETKKLDANAPAIIVNSEEELNSVLKSIDSFVDDLNTKEQTLELENGKLKATQTAKFSKPIGLKIGNWSSAKFNAYASLNVVNKKITKVNYRDQSLTGYTLGISLTKGSTSCSVSSDKRKATVRGTGTVNVNIIFEGIGTIFSKDYTASGTYTAK